MHEFFKKFQYDSAISAADGRQFQYNAEKVDQHYDEHKKAGKKHYAIMLENDVIGDIYLKNIKPEISCEIGIHIANDLYKGKGYGTTALLQMIQRIIRETNIKTIYADTESKNFRCIRMLENAGFSIINDNKDNLQYMLKIRS